MPDRCRLRAEAAMHYRSKAGRHPARQRGSSRYHAPSRASRDQNDRATLTFANGTGDDESEMDARRPRRERPRSRRSTRARAGAPGVTKAAVDATSIAAAVQPHQLSPNPTSGASIGVPSQIADADVSHAITVLPEEDQKLTSQVRADTPRLATGFSRKITSANNGEINRSRGSIDCGCR